jgi:hypothetical protein
VIDDSSLKVLSFISAVFPLAVPAVHAVEATPSSVVSPEQVAEALEAVNWRCPCDGAFKGQCGTRSRRRH